MKAAGGKAPAPLSPRRRAGTVLALVLIVGAYLAAAGAFPFVFESASIHYKSGADKALLRSGQVAGMLAAALLLLQLPLAARIKFLDRLFGLDRLYLMHRLNGTALCLLALIHPLLVFAPEDVRSIPVSTEYWPEIAGAVLLVAVAVAAATSVARTFLELRFHHWWLLHRPLAFAALALAVLHTLTVSDPFESGLPRGMLVTAASASLLLLAWVKSKPLRQRRASFTVAAVSPAARDAFEVTLEPRGMRPFSYLPGQFAFLRFHSPAVSGEEHPFTIASTPTRPAAVQFAIRCCGDWTRHVGHLAAGDGATMDGPFGRFNHLEHFPDARELIMIAGGIGITPMLSMLRYMADVGDRRQVTLLWSNRGPADVFCEEELDRLRRQWPELRVLHIFTEEPGAAQPVARLDRALLTVLLAPCSRSAGVFLCGPPGMMRAMTRELRSLGFARAAIRQERFQL
jgi:predicted ferric reductase